jgi:hypothetical protein
MKFNSKLLGKNDKIETMMSDWINVTCVAGVDLQKIQKSLHVFEICEFCSVFYSLTVLEFL